MKDIETQLNKLKNARMTDTEYNSMRKNIISFMEKTSSIYTHHVKSPFWHFMNPILVTVGSFVFLIGGTSITAYHASNSLPGDFLYSFKVNINEEVAGILIKSPKEKIIWEQNRITKRIEEIKQVAKTGDLTPEIVAIAEKNIDTHISNIDQNAKDLAKTNPAEFIATNNDLEPIINTHEQKLAEIAIPAENKISEITKTITGEINPLDEISAPEPVLKSVESQLIDNLINKVQKESSTLQEIANPIIQNGIPSQVKNEVVPANTLDTIPATNPTQ